MQATASSAVKWCLKKGGHVDADDMVSKIANLGTEGRHKANIERDFHTLLRSFSRRLGAKLSTVRARTMVHAKNVLYNFMYYIYIYICLSLSEIGEIHSVSTNIRFIKLVWGVVDKPFQDVQSQNRQH